MSEGTRIRYAPGDPVRVREGPPELHCRTPFYLRGRPGVVAEIAGIYRDPSKLALHHAGLPEIPLYRVRFAQSDLWQGPQGPDTLVADIYEHWLEPAAEGPSDAP